MDVAKDYRYDTFVSLNIKNEKATYHICFNILCTGGL